MILRPPKHRPNISPITIERGMDLEALDAKLRLAHPDTFAGISTYPNGKVAMVFTDKPENVPVTDMEAIVKTEVDTYLSTKTVGELDNKTIS